MKCYIDVTLRLIVDAEDGLSVDNIMDAIDIEAVPVDETVDVLDSEVTNFEITDAK
jgi:predicted lipid carrier protein YhbT